MSNKELFQSAKAVANTADTKNLAGGKAYTLEAKEALAQYISCGSFNGTFYATPKDSLQTLMNLLKQVDPVFVAKAAVYSRKNAWMKDMPSYLLAHLAATDIDLLKKVFPIVVDNSKILRNFVQIIRSGVTGRKSFGTAVKRLINNWLDEQTDERIFNASVGNNPSLADIIRMTHPRPQTKSRQALYAYILGINYNAAALPQLVQDYIAFKNNQLVKMPKVDFQFLTSLNLSEDSWKQIAKNASWHMARMNLNTFERHGIMNDTEIVDMLADKLANPELIAKSKVFPYQLFVAYKNYIQTSRNPNEKIKEALHNAIDISVDSLPDFSKFKISIGLDVSGSMRASATGGFNSSVRCVDVGAVITAAIKKKGLEVDTYSFDVECRKNEISKRDSIITNTSKLATVGGATDCSSFVRKLNQQSIRHDLVFIISDNMSWVDWSSTNKTTSLQLEWNKYKRRNKNAKLILLDIVPSMTSQAQSNNDVLNISGWNDKMFEVIVDFLNGESGKTAWIKKIESIKI